MTPQFVTFNEEARDLSLVAFRCDLVDRIEWRTEFTTTLVYQGSEFVVGGGTESVIEKINQALNGTLGTPVVQSAVIGRRPIGK